MTVDINPVFRSCQIMTRVTKFTTFRKRGILRIYLFNLFHGAPLSSFIRLLPIPYPDCTRAGC
jgi:hypothetical protein